MWVASLTLARCEAWVVRLAEEASGYLKVKGFYEGIHGHVPMRCQGGQQLVPLMVTIITGVSGWVGTCVSVS